MRNDITRIAARSKRDTAVTSAAVPWAWGGGGIQDRLGGSAQDSGSAGTAHAQFKADPATAIFTGTVVLSRTMTVGNTAHRAPLGCGPHSARVGRYGGSSATDCITPGEEPQIA